MKKNIIALLVLFFSGLLFFFPGSSGSDNLKKTELKAPSQNPSSEKKVIVLGFDGLSHTLLKRFIAEGKLPVMKKLVNRGRLLKIKPFHHDSPVLWTTYFTGVMPSVHGVQSFFKGPDEESRLILHDSRDVKVPQVWEILSQKGKSVGVAGFFANTPVPRDLNGFLISSRILYMDEVVEQAYLHLFPITFWSMLKRPKTDWIFPPQLEKRIHSSCSINQINECLDVFGGPGLFKILKAFPKKLVDDFLCSICNTLSYLDEQLRMKTTPDFIAVYLAFVDGYMHEILDWDPDSYPEEVKYFQTNGQEGKPGLILEAFKIFDRNIERYINSLDENTLLIILSDHGLHYEKSEKYDLDPELENGVVFLYQKNKPAAFSQLDKVTYTDIMPIILNFYEDEADKLVRK